jgi:hypothetical protein
MSLQDLIADVGPNGDINAKLNRAIRLRIIGGMHTTCCVKCETR